MNEEQKDTPSLHGRYVVNSTGKIVGRISISTARSEYDGRAYAFLCSNLLEGTNASDKLGYSHSYALVAICSATEQRVNRLLDLEFQFRLSNEEVTLYDLIK